MRNGAHRRARRPRLVTAGLAALAVLAVPSAAQAGGSMPHGRDRCTMIIGFEPSEPFAGRERADMTVTAASSAGKILRTQHVRITGVAVPAS